ncbi:MAG: glutamine amidotransferase-related protein, partial [Anaerolineales bacterium]
VLARRLTAKYRFEEISGEPCLLVRYHRVSPALLREVNARAVLVSGCDSEFASYREEELAGLRAVYREAAWPLLGFCAGLQLMAQTYGALIDAMGPALAEPVGNGPNPFPELGYQPGMKEEHGFTPVRVTQPHALFKGLGQPPVFFESHYWEVKAPPAGFCVLAETDLCPIQAMAHERLPLFGTQFHPEAYDEAHLDGQRLLANFLSIAGVMS